YWQRRYGIAETDYIFLNNRYLEGKPLAYIRSITSHELGHALGLCHKPGRYGSIMWEEHNDVKNSPTGIDQANYRGLWG
ncbi:hypothetical protein AB0Q96_36340, partial [Streptomyces sp. NPDC093111]